MGIIKRLLKMEPGLLHGAWNYENKGQIGEYKICYSIEHNLRCYFKILRNVYIPCDGSTTEADIIMICEKGIFVFESKNYKGKILGDITSEMWIQKIGNRSYSFYNPLKQNMTHIRSLSDFADIKYSSFLSYVIFSDKCDISNVKSIFEKGRVYYRVIKYKSLLHTIKKDMQNRDIIFSKDDVDYIYKILLPRTRVSRYTKKNHLEYATKRSLKKCPLCGGNIIVKKGIYGDFYGCENYPSCKYTKSIKK